jgi:quercetin dioxygenase-like cupin family protein
MKGRHVLVGAALVVGALLGLGIDRALLAQQTGIKRTILTRADDPGASTYEAVMGVAEIPPGMSAGKHRHPGIELGYVLEGTVVVEHEGKAPLTRVPGETFVNTGAHDAKNTGSGTAKILAVYLVEKGKPLAEPVK